MVTMALVRANLARASELPLRLRRRRCHVRVEVVVDGREVDTFRAADPATLRAALPPIYKHLPAANAAVRLVGVVEEWLPLNLARAKREVALSDSAQAQTFLKA